MFPEPIGFQITRRPISTVYEQCSKIVVIQDYFCLNLRRNAILQRLDCDARGAEEVSYLLKKHTSARVYCHNWHSIIWTFDLFGPRQEQDEAIDNIRLLKTNFLHLGTRVFVCWKITIDCFIICLIKNASRSLNQHSEFQFIQKLVMCATFIISYTLTVEISSAEVVENIIRPPRHHVT